MAQEDLDVSLHFGVVEHVLAEHGNVQLKDWSEVDRGDGLAGLLLLLDSLVMHGRARSSG